MSNKTKIEGVDLPYTLTDLGRVLYGFITDGDWENKACLDYYIPECNNISILNENFRIYSITDFGLCEGIYTDFYIEDRERRWKYNLLTAKTLRESEDAFIKMHEMAGYVCYKFKLYVENNLDNFIWSGFDVSYTSQNGDEVPYCWCGSLNRVASVANELRERHSDIVKKIYYVEKSTRMKREFIF